MKILGFNGSPRKSWNTATILDKVLAGAASAGAATERIDLYDLSYKGCVSCFACKKNGGASYGRCIQRDGLTPALDKVGGADALVIASPIYMGAMTGETHSFLERLIFPYLVYDKQRSSLFDRSISVTLIYTLGAPEEGMKAAGWDRAFAGTEASLARIFKGKTRTFVVSDTYQFDDYTKYEVSGFDIEHKLKRRETDFPMDCEKAYRIGVELAE